ncbi:unnamed protein product [Prorocentrum cordatum]|uniref:Uncharacterized protein n=1 Tax=Prorocentrum cordatum TaxID=2364126 RepID=A0ABN9WPC8_9DINO|nr:unnamed protein product [Polarella glacialis]
MPAHGYPEFQHGVYALLTEAKRVTTPSQGPKRPWPGIVVHRCLQRTGGAREEVSEGRVAELSTDAKEEDEEGEEEEEKEEEEEERRVAELSAHCSMHGGASRGLARLPRGPVTAGPLATNGSASGCSPRRGSASGSRACSSCIAARDVARVPRAPVARQQEPPAPPFRESTSAPAAAAARASGDW